MLPGPLAPQNPVRPVRIAHELEQLVVFDERIQQPLRILIMHVIIPRPMDIQQVPPAGSWYT